MPMICMICGNYHAGYSCNYCVKEKDDDGKIEDARAVQRKRRSGKPAGEIPVKPSGKDSGRQNSGT